MSLPPITFRTDTSGSVAIVVVAWLFPLISCLFVIARFYSRSIGNHYYGSDDWVVLASLVPLWGQTAILLITVYHGGMGHDYSDVPEQNRVLITKCLTILPMFFGSSLGLAKVSIVLFLIRIFGAGSRRFKNFAIVLLCYIIGWMLMSILVGGLTCVPLEKSWNPSIPGHCADLLGSHTAISALDILGDIFIILLPMPQIWKLHRDRPTKVLLTFVFGLGFFDIICGVLLVVSLVQILDTPDFTNAAVNAWLWTILEPSVAVMIACAPSLRPLYSLIRRGKARRLGFSNPERPLDNGLNLEPSRSLAQRGDIILETGNESNTPNGSHNEDIGHGRPHADGETIPLRQRSLPPGYRAGSPMSK